jgi:pilus assembly protein CpaF
MPSDYKDEIRQRFILEYSEFLSHDHIDRKDLEKKITHVLNEIIRQEHSRLSEEERKEIVSELLEEFIGLGPIEDLLIDPEVTEIMINGPEEVYVEKRGKTELTKITFKNEQQLMYLIDKILSTTRRHVDESFPYTEVALKGGARVNIVIPPLALNGPVLTIRKFLKELRSAEDLINLGTLDKRMSDFLIAAIKAKINIIFSGATGAGKTTSLNVYSSYISNDQRIITIEDTAELRLVQEHVVRLEAKQANIEGKGEITIRELFKNSLRMRPDRIILGEIRGAEALEMLQAICSGHKGALSVIHGSSPEDVIYRIETMILTSGVPITIEAIHRQIAAAIELIVQQEQLIDGSRKITQISQVNGLKDGQVVLEDIFVYDTEGTDAEGKVIGRWRATGIIPAFYPRFKKLRIDLPQEIFNKD